MGVLTTPTTLLRGEGVDLAFAKLLWPPVIVDVFVILLL